MSVDDGFGIIVGFSILLGVVLGLVNAYSQRNQQQEPVETDSEEILAIEDSEGDGLMLFDDPLFPPEFEDLED